MINLALAILATWRLAELLYFEDDYGPFNVAAMLRKWLDRLSAKSRFWMLVNSELHCFWCCAFWAALPVTAIVAQDWREVILLPFALSGAAILLSGGGRIIWRKMNN
jgi:hypothetical protein